MSPLGGKAIEEALKLVAYTPDIAGAAKKYVTPMQIISVISMAKSAAGAIQALMQSFQMSFSKAQTTFNIYGPHLRGSIKGSTQAGNNKFKRSRVLGDDAVINQLVKSPRTISLGPSIRCDNTSFMRELLNRNTKVSVQGAYHYNAEQGLRSWHMQHFRHNAYNNAAQHAAASSTYDNDWYTYHGMTKGTDAGNIELIDPERTSQTGPARLSTYKPVGAFTDGDTDQYSPFSIVDLENISYFLQQGKQLVAPNSTISTSDNVVTNGVWAQTKQLMPDNKFASRSLIYRHNQLIEPQFTASGGVAAEDLSDHPIKLKPVLLGGKVEYRFVNTGISPATITIIVYKVKQSFAYAPKAYPEPSATTPNPNVVPAPQFEADFLKSQLLADLRKTYLDKGDKIRLKQFDGRVPVDSDVTVDADYQLLPNLRSKTPSGNPFVEQHRYTVVVAAGQSEACNIRLPGRMYNPCSLRNTNSPIIAPPTEYRDAEQPKGEDENAVEINSSLYSPPKHWSGEQFSVAIGVTGSNGMLKFTNPADATDSVVEGHQCSAASVTCQMRYSERIGAMNMQIKSQFTNGTAALKPPVAQGTTQPSSIMVVPVTSAERPTDADGIISLQK